MKRVSFVFQDCDLFKDTLLNNIRAARPQAAEAEVRRALEAARCEDIIEKMPQGLHTVVGTKSKTVSIFVDLHLLGATAITLVVFAAFFAALQIFHKKNLLKGYFVPLREKNTQKNRRIY